METPENGQKRRNIADIDLRSLESAGFDAVMRENQLFEVSLVKNPLNPACRIVSVTTPAGPTTFYDNLHDGQDQEC